MSKEELLKRFRAKRHGNVIVETLDNATLDSNLEPTTNKEDLTMAKKNTTTVTRGPLSTDERALLEKLRAENAELKKGIEAALYCKVSEKGGVSVYGLGRFPVTLYKEQWEKLLAFAPTVKQFMKDHDGSLATKN